MFEKPDTSPDAIKSPIKNIKGQENYTWGEPLGGTDHLGRTNSMTYNESSRLVESTSDWLGETTQIARQDIFGRVTQSSRFGLVTNNDFNDPLSTVHSSSGNGLTERVTTVTRDNAMRGVKSQESGVFDTESIKYDNFGSARTKTFGREIRNKVGADFESETVQGNTVAQSENEQEISFDGSFFLIENNRSSGPNPAKTTIKKDAFGRLREIRSPSPSGSGELVTTYEYHFT